LPLQEGVALKSQFPDIVDKMASNKFQRFCSGIDYFRALEEYKRKPHVVSFGNYEGKEKFIEFCMNEIKELRPQFMRDEEFNKKRTKHQVTRRFNSVAQAQPSSAKRSFQMLKTPVAPSMDAIPELKSRQTSAAMEGSSSVRPVQTEFYCNKWINQPDEQLKGFSCAKHTYEKDSIDALLEKKKQNEKAFEFCTAPKASRRVLTNNANASSSMQSLISKYQDSSQLDTADSQQSPSQPAFTMRHKDDPFLRKSKIKAASIHSTQRHGVRNDPEMVQMFEDIVTNTMKLSQPQQHDIRFGQEKFLRHPLKDGINLLMIGQELQRETKQLEPIKLFQEAMSETKIGDEAPDHFYLPKVLEYGSFCLTQKNSLRRKITPCSLSLRTRRIKLC